MYLEDLGLIGNCQFSALVSRSGAVVWCCLPRFDSEPIFATLLDHDSGFEFLIGPADGGMGEQRYLPNTNILETTFTTDSGVFRVLDFAPRFFQFGRVFRPTQLFRIVEPIEGSPRVQVRCQPILGWSRKRPQALAGSNHIHFEGYEGPVRLTSDIPLSYIGGTPFALSERRHAVLTWGAPIQEPLEPLCDRFLGETERYWQHWVKHCDIPPHYQRQVIRSALALKLHCFEDTGAIAAALTTSIPESPNSTRTWDYRYCWLRDAYYALAAFTRLGHFEEREHFTRFLLNVASATTDLQLAPLYRVDGTHDLDETLLEGWPGFNGFGPVRVGNRAVEYAQNDIFGEMVLALSPVFLDERFDADRSPAAFQLLEDLARRAIKVAGTPDAGIWEHRTEPQARTFSSLMSWAAADRMAMVAARHASTREQGYRIAADRIRNEIAARAWNKKIDAFVGTYDGSDLDASILQMVRLRMLPKDDPRVHATVDAINAGLSHNGWLYRYQRDDGFGQPTVAFTICTFWLVEAFAALGRFDEARATMDRICATIKPLGLLSEDYEPMQGRMWGNFPQAYSHVGLIHAAFASSPSWFDIL